MFPRVNAFALKKGAFCQIDGKVTFLVTSTS